MAVHKRLILALWSVAVLITAASASLEPEGGEESVKGGINPNSLCIKGQRQSPIDLPHPPTEKHSVKHVELTLNKEYYKSHAFRTVNEHGLTLQGDIKDGTKLFAEGELMEGEKYIFDSFHFHWGPEEGGAGSEHHIDGKLYATEMHILHYNAKYPNRKAALKSGDPKALAIFAILFELSSTSSLALRPILKTTTGLLDPDEKTKGANLNLPELIFNWEKRVTFGHYLGSLTSGGCDEVVVWNVKMTPNPISKDQLKALAQLRSQGGKPLVNNWRGTRPINGRKIDFYKVEPNL